MLLIVLAEKNCSFPLPLGGTVSSILTLSRTHCFSGSPNGWVVHPQKNRRKLWFGSGMIWPNLPIVGFSGSPKHPTKLKLPRVVRKIPRIYQPIYQWCMFLPNIKQNHKLEDQTLNQRFHQRIAPHPPILSRFCKQSTVLPPLQGSARCQLPHRSKVEGCRPELFVGANVWPIFWPHHLWPNLFVGWHIWYITSPVSCQLPHCLPKRRIPHATILHAGSAKIMFCLGTLHVPTIYTTDIPGSNFDFLGYYISNIFI